MFTHFWNPELKRLQSLRARHAALLNEIDREIRLLLQSVDIVAMARHNMSLLPYAPDPFTWFIEFEKGRFLNAIDWLSTDNRRGTVCDLGCLFPYLPLALTKLGFAVTIVEKFDLYGSDFRLAVHRFAETHHIRVVELDIVHDPFEELGEFDHVLLMAVVEHLIGSPRALMLKIRSILREHGHLLFEVPNLAELSRRIAFLFGRSPLPNYTDYLASDYPYFGHNREMTVSEVTTLMSSCGFMIERLLCYDYNLHPRSAWRDWLMKLLKTCLPLRNVASAIAVHALVTPSGG